MRWRRRRLTTATVAAAAAAHGLAPAAAAGYVSGRALVESARFDPATFRERCRSVIASGGVYENESQNDERGNRNETLK